LARNGEFQQFYQANYGRVVATVTAVLGDGHEAEDVAQEAFARAYLRWRTIRDYELPAAWVHRVALRLATDSGRRLRRSIRLITRLSAVRQDEAPAAAESLALSPLGHALRRVPVSQRQVLVLHYLLDLPVDVIAREYGLPPGTVKTRLAAGRKRLERELASQQQEVRDAR
jgi:RNA polymerase sigma-70 factor, ECF subfamily